MRALKEADAARRLYVVRCTTPLVRQLKHTCVSVGCVQFVYLESAIGHGWKVSRWIMLCWLPACCLPSPELGGIRLCTLDTPPLLCLPPWSPTDGHQGGGIPGGF